MSLKHGVYAQEKATSLVTPLVADVGIPFVVGAAPVQSTGSPARPNVPVLCTSWDEAVAKLGFSYDWEAYPICEFMYSHFQLFGCQPVIFCNVMDPGTIAPMAAADTSGEYAVYYFAACRNGEQLWEIDKRNMKCVILGVDYMADVRKALGKQ